MDKKIPTSRIILSVIVGIITSFTMLFLLSSANTNVPYDNALTLNEGWTLTINDTVQEQIALDQTTFEPTGRGDIVILEGVIPENSYQAPMLRVWICHSMMKVFIDGEQIYTFGEIPYENNDLIGSGYHWISLPHDCSGSTLKIVFAPGEDNAFTNFAEVLISEAEDGYKDLVSETFANICAGMFLVVFGMGIIVIAGILTCAVREYTSFIYTGVFSLLIGTWTLCNKGDIQLISDNYTFNQYLEYFSIYLGPIPLFMFLSSIRKERKRGFDFAKVLIGADVLLIVVTVILHAIKIMQFPMMVPVFHCFYSVVVGYVIISCIYNIRKGNSEEQLLLLGIVIMTVCLAYDIAIFNIAKYMDGSLSKYMGITAWGGLAFVVCMIISYTKYMYRGICSKMEKEMLLSMAYMDNLTKLANHAKYTQELLDMEQGAKQVAVIMFDLNDLKKTNDTLGHSEGDMLLCSFANILKNCFAEKGLAARTGGDEFVVLLQECSKKEVDKLMKQYQSLIEKENKKGHAFQVSAAYGVAYNSEDGGISVIETTKRADARMYECKAEMKKA